MHKIASLQYITQDNVPGFSHASLAKEACAGGVRWVQLRSKIMPYSDLEQEAVEAKMICRKYDAKLIINDNVNLAKEIKADGVHLGKQDMLPEKARELLGPDYIIGGTANTIEDIKNLALAKVDYIGLGPFRFTTTKNNLSPVLGIAGYKTLIQQSKGLGIHIPIIAIGGIKPDDVENLLLIGLHGIAISSFINQSIEKSEAAKSLVFKMNSAAINN